MVPVLRDGAGDVERSVSGAARARCAGGGDLTADAAAVGLHGEPAHDSLPAAGGCRVRGGGEVRAGVDGTRLSAEVLSQHSGEYSVCEWRRELAAAAAGDVCAGAGRK